MNKSSKAKAKKIAKASLEMVNKACTSHIGSCLSIIDILSVLYSHLNLEKIKNSDIDRDRVFISKGHASAAVYACLAEFGFIEKTELLSFSQNGSRLQAHVSHKVPGVEISSGSLGHGFSIACGTALVALKQCLASKYYVIMSDGELNEGSNWEALMFAAHHQLSNLTIFIDCNKLQSFGRTEEVLNLEPLTSKFESFNCSVLNIDGHDHEEIYKSISFTSSKPKVIIAHTVKGKGVSFMEDKLEWHYKSPDEEQLARAIKEIDNA